MGGGVRNLPNENVYEDIILKRAEEYFNSKNLTIDRKDDRPSYDEKKNAYYFDFSHGNYAERFTARIYIKPKNYKFKNKNNENKNFTNENYKKLIMDSVKNNNKEILSIKESEDDNFINSVYYEEDGFWGTKKAYYYYYFDVDVTTKSGTKTTKLLFDLDPKRINLPEDFKITKQEYYNQKLDCEHINLILEKIKSENEILFRKGELSLKKNEIKFDFDKKKYYFEVRYRDHQYYYDQKYYLDVEDDYRKKIDLSENNEYTPLYYNKIFINPDKYDSYKKFGILHFDYLFYNDSEFFHNIYNVIPPKRSYDDFKDIEDYMKFTPYKLKDFYAFNQQDEDSLKLDLSYIYVKLNKKETKEFDSNYLIKIDNKENIKVAFLENINKDLFLTEQNKKDIIKLLQEYSDNSFYKIEIIDEKLQKENKDNLFYINIRLYIDENNKFESKFFIFTDTPYQLEMDVNSLTKKIKNSVCPDSEIRYLDFPEYGRSCNNAFRYKIVIPNIIDLKYKKNKECIPNETVPQLPIPPKPQISTKKVTTITPKQNNENKKEEIVENKEKSNIENIKNEVEINNFKNGITRNIKTGDNLFNIIYLIGTFGIFAYFINLMKNKHRNKLILFIFKR